MGVANLKLKGNQLFKIDLRLLCCGVILGKYAGDKVVATVTGNRTVLLKFL